MNGVTENIHGSLTRTRTYTEAGHVFRIVAKVRYTHLNGNANPHLSVTGELWRKLQGTEWRYYHGGDRKKDKSGTWGLDSCGCVHDEIGKHFPEIAETYLPFHLWDGLPMHYEANALHWWEFLVGKSRWGSCRNALNTDKDYSDPLHPRTLTDHECRQRVRTILIEHVGYGLSEQDTPRRLLTRDREAFRQWLKSRAKDIFARFGRAVEQLWTEGDPVHRHRTCLECDHEWDAPVEHTSETSNLSSEKTVDCPECGSRQVVGGPYFVPKKS